MNRIIVHALSMAAAVGALICMTYVVANDLTRDAIFHASLFAMSWAWLWALGVVFCVRHHGKLSVFIPEKPKWYSIILGISLIVVSPAIGFSINALWNENMNNLFLAVYGMFGLLVLGGIAAFYVTGFRVARREPC